MTNEIVKKQAEQIKSKNEAALTQSVSSSLLGKLRARSSDKCILVDLSGSMSEQVGGWKSQSETKYQIVEATLKNFPDSRIIAFNSSCTEITGLKLPLAGGGTNMGYAFVTCKDKGIKHIVLITDGIPDSESSAFVNAAGLEIDIIYIGPDPIPDFLRKLASASSGEFTNIKLINESAKLQLKGKIAGLLNS